MSQILVRDLDKKTVDRLKKRASRNRRSLQAEAKLILEQAATEPSPDRREVLAALKKYRARFAGRTFSDSAELIREDRDR